MTRFSKSGDEDAPLAFTAAEFSQHFFGMPGASLAAVKIVSLPPAGNGVLALAGIAVTAGQEIPVADLDGLVFTPAADWNGDTSFLWNGKDGGTYAAADATVTLTINPVNDAPVVSATPLADVTVNEDADNSTIDLSAGFVDIDGEALTYVIKNTSPDLISTSVDGASLTLDFLEDQNGAVTLVVMAVDAAQQAVTNDFTVTVNPVNDAPTASAPDISVEAGKSQTILLSYGDVETAQADLAVIFDGPSAGVLDTSALPNVTYTAPAGFDGYDNFTYIVTDRGDPDGCTAAPCSGALATSAFIKVTVLPAPSGSISGQAFNDANGNRSLDEGESGLAGVTVRLLDASGVIGEATTAADGAYAFTGLAAGTYQVRQVVLPAGFVPTTGELIDVTLAEDVAKTVNFGSVVSADLKVTMTASVDKKTIIYAIVVTNDGPADAAEAVLTDPLPEGTAYVSAMSSLGTCSGGKTLTCNFGTLANGSSAMVTLKVNRTNTKIAIVNTASVSSSTFDIDMADNSVTVTIQ